MEVHRNIAVQNNPVAEISIEKTGMMSGLIVCASLIVWFMLMKFTGIVYSPVAWGFNFIILFGGIYFTYRYYRSETKLNIDYFPGLILGCITTAAGVIPFTLFLYIFFSSVDPLLLTLLKDNDLFMGVQITPMRASVATLVEGISSGVIISFMMMQYYKSGFRRMRREKKAHG